MRLRSFSPPREIRAPGPAASARREAICSATTLSGKASSSSRSVSSAVECGAEAAVLQPSSGSGTASPARLSGVGSQFRSHSRGKRSTTLRVGFRAVEPIRRVAINQDAVTHLNPRLAPVLFETDLAGAQLEQEVTGVASLSNPRACAANSLCVCLDDVQCCRAEFRTDRAGPGIDAGQGCRCRSRERIRRWCLPSMPAPACRDSTSAVDQRWRAGRCGVGMIL